MFKLTIRKQDGSIYWTEHFNSEPELNRWLDTEKTRPYWNRQYTTEIEDLTPPPPTQEEIDAELERQNSIQTLKDRLKNFSNLEDLTQGQIKQALMSYLKLKSINGEF